MKFIVDAQLPRKLSSFLKSKGFDSIHTLEHPEKNFTPDTEIILLAEVENRVVITKDSDFYEYKLIKGKPGKLLFLVTGNISNDILIALFKTNLSKIIELLNNFDIVEMDTIALTAK